MFDQACMLALLVSFSRTDYQIDTVISNSRLFSNFVTIGI